MPKLTDTFADRQKAAAEAKKALLERFKPKPMVTSSEPIVDRAAEKAAKIAALKAKREEEKAARAAARVAAQQAAESARAAEEAAQLEARRAAIKERKAAEKNAAHERRAAKLAAYAQFKMTGRKAGDELY
ncbi:MAG: hypothetical protein K1X35_02820 [Caulobacteraceae bacterium]|nr:hypothetical protein [Caulobacteraceae bacterium]